MHHARWLSGLLLLIFIGVSSTALATGSAPEAAPEPDPVIRPAGVRPEVETTTTTLPPTTTTQPPPTTTTTTTTAAPPPEPPPTPPPADRTVPAPAEGDCSFAIPCHIVMAESGGSYTAANPNSTACGAYQILDGTWAGFGGYSSACDAPPGVQDARAAELWAGGAGCFHWSGTTDLC